MRGRVRGSSQSSGRVKGEQGGRQRGRGQDGDVAGSCPPRGTGGFTLGGCFADVSAAGGAAFPRPRTVSVGVTQLLAGPQGAPQHHGARTGLCCKTAAPSTVPSRAHDGATASGSIQPPHPAPHPSPVPALPSAVPWVCSWGARRVGAVPGQRHRLGTLWHWGGAAHPLPATRGLQGLRGGAQVCTERSHRAGGLGGYLCAGRCRPGRSRRSSTCGPRGSPCRQRSGWGTLLCRAALASEGRGRVWLQGGRGSGSSLEPAAPPAPPCPCTAMGGCGPVGLPHGICSPGSGRDSSAGHHPSPCPAGCPRCPRGPRGRCLTWLCGQAACAAAVGAALLRRAAGGVVAAARPAARPAGAGTGAVAWALCRGRRSVHGVPGSGGPLGTPPAPAAGSPPHPIARVWPYLWRGGGRRGRPRGGSTSQPRGSCGRRGSTACWGAGGCSPLPGTRLLCPGLAGWLAACGPAGHGAAGGRQWGQRHGPLLGAAGLGRGEAPRTGPGAPAPGCQHLAS